MASPTKQASLAKEGPFYRDSDYSSLSNRLRHSTVERARLVAGGRLCVCAPMCVCVPAVWALCCFDIILGAGYKPGHREAW